MQAGVGLLVSDVMPIYMIMPRYLIIIRFSINCSTVICSPTVILMLSWEKSLVKPMASGSIFHHISFRSILFCNLYFPIYTTKIPKIFTLLSLLDLSFASDREGIDNPLSRWLWGVICFVQVLGDARANSYWIDTLVLKNWGKYLRYFAASSLPLRGN